MKNETLLRALSSLDDDFICRAHESLPRQNKGGWLRVASLAACFIVAVCLCFPLIRYLRDVDKINEAMEKPTSEDIAENVTTNTERFIGTMTLFSDEGNIVTLKLSKTDQTPFEMVITYPKAPDSETKGEESNVSVLPKTAVHVEGMTGNTVTAPGEYTVTVDFSVAPDTEIFTVVGFGSINRKK